MFMTHELCQLLGSTTYIYHIFMCTKVYHIFSSSSFFEKKTKLLFSYAMSVRPSVRPSVVPSVLPSVRPSVEIISFRGNLIFNRPIDLKIGLNDYVC